MGRYPGVNRNRETETKRIFPGRFAHFGIHKSKCLLFIFCRILINKCRWYAQIANYFPLHHEHTILSLRLHSYYNNTLFGRSNS